jgi:Putative beta barrel porin-7 (BBP7)
MKIKTLLLAFAAVVALVMPRAAHSQDAVGRMVSWFTGSDVGCDASCTTAAKCYAEDIGCSTGTCGSCNECCKRCDVWGSVEFLMWWGKGTDLPPLVTTALPGTPGNSAGILGLSSTSVLFGDEMGGNKLQGGGRITAGIWLDPAHDIAVGGRFFGLGGDTTRFSQASTGDPILAIPFNNALLGQPDALLVAFPGLSTGSISASLSTNNIIGFEAFTEIMMLRDTNRRIDLIGGYQFLRLDDELNISSDSTFAGGPLTGTLVEVDDTFRAQNEFHGGVIGLKGRMARGQWSLEALGKLGLGNMRQEVTISGQTAVTPSGGGAPLVSTGGLFAQDTNIGTFERNKFCFVPELTFNLKYHVSPCVNFHIGYNILWLSEVALSADQLDRNVDVTGITGSPVFAFQDNNYWLQGINFGMGWDF